MAVSSDTGARLFTMGGPVTSATPGVRHTATDNLACLIAITRALTWAADDPVANPILPIGEHSRPICIRYDNEYAAMIATGVWKAKKHKDAAPLAQRAWKRLKARKGERLWIQHASARGTRETGTGCRQRGDSPSKASVGRTSTRRTSVSPSRRLWRRAAARPARRAAHSP